MVQTSGNIGMEADGSIRMSGGQVMTEASSALKLSSDGMTKIDGKVIRMG